MRFLQVSAMNGVAVAVRMATALVLNKILAVLVGPAGYALIGQFQNVVGVALILASGATAQGVTRYTAEHHDDMARQRTVWRTAGAVTLFGSAIGAFVLFAGGPWLAEVLLEDASQAYVFAALGLALAPLGLNALLLAILQGRKETRAYVVANIAGSLVGLALTGGLALSFGLQGALLALAVNQSVAFGATLLVARRLAWFSLSDLAGRIDWGVARNLGRYALMGLVAAVALPVAQTAIRQDLIGTQGLEAAGLWDAMNRLSGMALLFFTSTLSVYYLPRIAELRDDTALRGEVRTLVAMIAPAVIIIFAVVWLLRGFIVDLLFDPAFLPMTGLFGWQLAGDVLKIISWIFAYVMIGRGLAAKFITTEVVFNFSYAASAIAVSRQLGLQGVVIVYALNYLVYLIVVYWIYSQIVRPRPAGGNDGGANVLSTGAAL